MIEIRDLCVRFGPKEILKGLSLVIEEGKTTVIIGRSGIGKSVLLKCILGLTVPVSGSILIDGREFLNAGPADKKGMIAEIGMLLQNGGLFDSMTIFDNIAFALRYHKKFPEAEIQKRVRQYARIVEIDESLSLFPKDLSGGMRRRAALARAIILEPKYLFYDEPTTGLDPTSSALVEILIRRLKEELGITTLIVTHDIDMVRFLAEVVALLEGGVITFRQTREEAFRPDSPIYDSFIANREKLHFEHGYR